MSQSGSYSGQFSGGGSGSSSGASVVVSITGNFSTSFTVGDDGLLSGTWEYSGSLTGTATAGDLTVPINESVAGSGPLSGTLAAFSGSATSGPLAGFSAGFSGGATSFSFSGGGSAEGVSVSVSGSASGSLSDAPPSPPPPDEPPPPPPPDDGPVDVITFPSEAGWDAVPIGDGMRFVGPQFNVDDATGAWSLVSPPAPGTYTSDEAQYVSGPDRASYFDAVSQTLALGAIASRDAGAPQVVQDFYGAASTATTIFNIETSFIERVMQALDPARLVNALTFGVGVAQVESDLQAAQDQISGQTQQAAQDAIVDAAAQGTFVEYLVNFWRSAKLVSHHSAESFTMQNGSAPIIAGDHRDVMLGTADGDTFSGGGNDDIAISWLGADSLRGGDGNDQLYGGLGRDTLVGDAGDDFIVAGQGKDLLLGAAGNDTLRGGIYDDTLRGGLGNDLLYGGTENDLVLGGDNRDTLDGGEHDDWLEGGGGLDSLFGGEGNDTLDGGVGNDTLRGSLGDDSLVGNDGFDQVFAGQGSDVLRGGFQGDTLNGGEGNDFVAGGGGMDLAGGGQGDDSVLGGEGNDTVAGGAGNDSLVGGNGNDLFPGGAGNDTIDGGAGNDLLDFGTDALGVHVSLMAGGAGSATSTALGTDVVVGVEGALGGSGADTLAGADSLGGYYFSGGAGNDLIGGNAEADTLLGSLGDDSVSGGAGNDSVRGGDGNDTLLGGEGDDMLSGGPGDDAFVWTATALGSGDMAASGVDLVTVDPADADVFLLDGVTDELEIGGTLLDALTADTGLGTAIDATNSIAFVGEVIQIDVDLDGAFNAANDFQIDLTGSGVNTVTYDSSNDVLTFA